MAAQRQRSSSELIDDAISEILLRVPPDEPQCLFRASLVSRPWRGLVSDAAFLRRYRRFHGTPPLLGFFFNGTDHFQGEIVPRFVPTTPASPFPGPMMTCIPWASVDCRHGLLLLQSMAGGRFVAWDPITGTRRELDQPCISYKTFAMALLCAVPGCDHRDCHGGPFLVVWVCSDVHVVVDEDDGIFVEWKAKACVYSSEVGSWGTSVSVPIAVDEIINPSRGALAGDSVYFLLGAGFRILKYDLVNHCLSVIDPPEAYRNGIFIVPTEDGLLGVAGIKGTSLCLWSWKVNAEGVEGWMQYRVIELQTLFPDDNRLDKATVIGFSEGVRVIFIDSAMTRAISTINLNSGQVRTVSGPGLHYPIVPFTSFYTPGCACGKLPLPAGTNHWQSESSTVGTWLG